MKWIHVSKAKPVFNQLYLVHDHQPQLDMLKSINATGYVFEGREGNDITPTHIAAVTLPEAITSVADNDNLALN